MAKHNQVVDEKTSRTAASEETLRTSLDRLTAAEHELQAAEEVRKARDEELQRAAEEADEAIGLSIEALEAEHDRIREEMQPIEERIRELREIRSRYRIERLAATSVPGVESVGVPGVIANETAAGTRHNAEGEAPQAESSNGEATEDDWYEVLKRHRTAESSDESADLHPRSPVGSAPPVNVPNRSATT